MEFDDPPARTADEQLGSPGWTFERGLLLGLLVGVVILTLWRRRSGRPADGVPAS